jgi:C2 domain
MSQSMDGEVPSTSYAANEVVQAQVEEPQKRKEAVLRQHSFFQLKVHIISGHNLVAMDKSGTSDPYVKFKAGSRMLHKTKTVHKDLNPVWDEVFTTPIDDPFQPINIKVMNVWSLVK